MNVYEIVTLLCLIGMLILTLMRVVERRKNRERRFKRTSKTQTIVTEGYPEAGPFATENEAMGAFVPPFGSCVLSVEHRDDGWYRTYMVGSTTSLCYTYQASVSSQAYPLSGWLRAIVGLIKRAKDKYA